MACNQDGSTIERFRASDNFTLISNLLAQDEKLSADATLVALFLLSLPTHKKDGTPWDIHPRHVWNSKNISRDRVYKAFNELIDFGYMEKVQKHHGNLRAEIIYRISCLKKFFRDPGSQDAVSQDYNKNIGKKEEKEVVCCAAAEAASREKASPSFSQENNTSQGDPMTAEVKHAKQTPKPPIPKPPLESEPKDDAAIPLKTPPARIESRNSKGELSTHHHEEIIRLSTCKRESWTMEQINSAWMVLANYNGVVNDAYAFIAGTIKKMIMATQSKNIAKVAKGKGRKKLETGTISKKPELTQEEIAHGAELAKTFFSQPQA